MFEKLPYDSSANALIAMFRQAQDVIRQQVVESLASGVVGSVAYRRRRASLASLVLRQLISGARPRAALLVRDAYALGASMTDPQGTMTGSFGQGIHFEAISALADNLTNSLENTVNHIGRRVNDVYRRAGLEQTALSLMAGGTRRESSKRLIEQLEKQGVKGFTDKAGRHWNMDTYAGMVIRTTSRQATSHAVRNNLLRQDRDLVKIPAHRHPSDSCSPYDGKTFSLTGRTEGYPVLDKLPPFHPNCRHVLAPAVDNLDELEKRLDEMLSGTR